ncbi:GlsB/YeaQ/YmgE family stress response membrane protein [Neisseriaceae bacterium ESL0693]|nr:GlsB/YeaQ/YmgE family stress response membrane protein [Neisseriaceae bacterium ESL0693]
MGLIWTIIVGFIVGVIAKFLYPGRQNIGFIVTALLGIGGSLLAGYVGQAMGWYHVGQSAGFIASVVFACIILFIYGKIKAK